MEFSTYTKYEKKLNVKSDGVIINIDFEGYSGKQPLIMLGIKGNGINGYAIKCTSGVDVPIRNEDLEKFQALLPIATKYSTDLANQAAGKGCLGVVVFFALILFVLGKIDDKNNVDFIEGKNYDKLVQSGIPKEEAIFLSQNGYIDSAKKNPDGRYLLVQASFPEGASDSQLFTNAAIVAKNVTEVINANPKVFGTIPNISIEFMSGRPEEANRLNYLSIEFPTSKFKLLDIEKFTAPEILDLADLNNLEINDRGHNGLTRWCETNEEFAPNICIKK